MKTFQPKQFIVTKEGFRGYVVKKLEYCPNMYEVRLASGLTLRGGEDLKVDPLMEDNPWTNFITEKGEILERGSPPHIFHKTMYTPF